MDLSIGATMVIYAAIFFMAGIGWGQWWAERSLRKDNIERERGRMSVGLPINAEDASATLELLSLMVKDVEGKRKARDKTGANAEFSERRSRPLE